MPDCIYNTDPPWALVLRDQNLGPEVEVNFWRKDKRSLHLPRGALFYFKLRGEKPPRIVGRARFVKQRDLTIAAAWQQFGESNGVKSLRAFVVRAAEVLGVLNSVDWLPEWQWVPADANLFPPNILACRFIEGAEAAGLDQEFQVTRGRGAPPSPSVPAIAAQSVVPSASLPGLPAPAPALPDDPQRAEGAKTTATVNRHERDPEARRRCITAHGWLCWVCRFSFRDTYGPLGEEFVYVHHRVPLGARDGPYVPDPERDLVPVCGNCHPMIHRKASGRELGGSLAREARGRLIMLRSVVEEWESHE